MTLVPADARVLVVEDDRDNMTVTLDLLRLAGVTHVASVTGAAGAADAAAGLAHVDLVLLDINLPDGDGRALLPRLRALPACRTARFVAVTASVMPDEVARTAQAGFDGFIGKPLDYDRFPDQVRALLRGEKVWQAR